MRSLVGYGLDLRTTRLVFLFIACSIPVTQALSRISDDLDDNRQPALYTQDFGDCNGASILDISRFDVALYLDNRTVTFHLQGNSLVSGLQTMMFLSVFAYGRQFFVKIFDPCFSSIGSLCPSNITRPIEVNGYIPLAPSDIEGIPSIAFSIPDFEGQAMLRVFDNATESEIACYSAMITNGNTMSWPASVGSIMGFTIFCSLLASFLSSVYGVDTADTRTHYAHSMSIFVVFATLQHVYFTGALSMNWASVLPAFWSNFSWSAGMIHSASMQNSINTLNGNYFGNTSVVGAAGVGHAEHTAGGYDLQAIYKRDLHTLSDVVEDVRNQFEKRSLANSSTGFYWYGYPVSTGLPIPGNFTGFPGTLSFENIPASNAFMTGFLWLLILIVLLVLNLSLVRFALELLIKYRWLQDKHLPLFRRYWIGFTIMVVARTFFIASFIIMFLSFFQFAYGGSPGVKAITAIMFIIFLVCMVGITLLSLYYRLRDAEIVPDRMHLEFRTAWKVFPCLAFISQNDVREQHKLRSSLFSIPWLRVEVANLHASQIHQDEAYIRRYGWLVSRYCKSKWWFSALWLIYEFFRAVFYGGAAGQPSTQVFGLLVVEIIAFIAMIKMKPFESTRLNVLMIWLLGLSKVVTVALSSAFHPVFGLQRILAAGIAFVIIVIQSLLLVVMMILIFIGMFSTFFSISRNKASLPNPNWQELRTKWFDHIALKTRDERPRPNNSQPGDLSVPTTAFNIGSVRRLTVVSASDMDIDYYNAPHSQTSLVDSAVRPTTSDSRAASIHSNMSYSNLPFGARPHLASWTHIAPPLDDSPRMQGHFFTQHILGSDPVLRNSYDVVPANRSSSYCSSFPQQRRLPSSTNKPSVISPHLRDQEILLSKDDPEHDFSAEVMNSLMLASVQHTASAGANEDYQVESSLTTTRTKGATKKNIRTIESVKV